MYIFQNWSIREDFPVYHWDIATTGERSFGFDEVSFIQYKHQPYITPDVSVPEPSTGLLTLSGLFLLIALRKLAPLWKQEELENTS